VEGRREVLPSPDARRLQDLLLETDPRAVLQGYLALLPEEIPVAGASLALLEPGGQRLRLFGPTGARREAEDARTVPLAGTAVAAALRDGREQAEPRSPLPEGAFGCLFPSRAGPALVVPLLLHGRPLGSLNVWTDRATGFRADEAAAVRRLEGLLAVAVENLGRYRRIAGSERRYRALLENASGPVAVVDLDGRRLLEVNARALRWTGYSRSEILGASLERLAGPDLHPLRLLRGLLRRGQVEFETQVRHAEGHLLPAHAKASLIREGEMRLVQFELQDLTEMLQRERMLLQERAVSRSLLQSSNSFICSLDVRGRLRLFNRKFEEETGRSADEVHGTDAAGLVPERARKLVRERLAAAFQGTDLVRCEVPVLGRDGAEIVLLLSSSVLREEDGRVRELLLIGTDVTESAQLQSDLVESERRSKSAYEQLREFSAVSSSILQEKDLDRICDMFVQALREHSNFQRAILTLLDEEFRGYKWFFAGLSDSEIETFHRNRLTGDQRVTIFQERFRLGNSYYITHDSGWEYVGVRSVQKREEQHDWHPDDFLFIPLYGSNRKMVGIVSVDDPRDGARPTADTISPIELFANQVAHSIEQAKLDQEVRRSTEKYRTLVDSMNDGLLAVDLTNRVTFVNPALMELVGYSEHAILHQSIHRFLDPESQAAFRREVRHRERRSRFEVTLLTRNGEAIPVLVSASPFYQNSQLVGTFAILSDLREQKKADAAFKQMHQEIVEANDRLKEKMEELRLAQEQLIQAEKLSALGELISGVAHELNNPLTGVMGFSQLLMASNCDEKMGRTLAKINSEATRCQKIVQNLLTFARRHAAEQGPVQINEILDATIDLRAYQLKVDNIEIVRELDENLPRTTGDFHQLQQVFINIINNAHQAMLEAHGRGRLIIRTERDADRIRIRFIDDGPGIPEDKIGKIFDPFFTTKEPGRGTGLGLSLSYGIVSEHEGTIAAASMPGEGTEFTVELPIREPSEDREGTTPEGEGPGTAPRSRILVVDDEEVILDLLSSILESGGHRVDTARNGRLALEKLRRGHYDLIISDLKMPDIGGQGLWESVRAFDPDLSRRMIFSTGDTVNPSTQAFFKKTGSHYLSKPFRLEEIERTIQRVLAEIHNRNN
jgi:PAS domain S-box-containing protein